MDFDAILAHVRQFLRRQGRVSYRALKLRFNLDDEAVAALKDELIYAERVAHDEDDRVLVWVGAGDTTSEPASMPPPAREPDPLPSDDGPPKAERRQLTALFCDLVDSTTLASQLDPEDLRQVVWAYQQTCAQVVQRFGGHIAQLLGDGVLVYFGWPQAHEDDAQGAVRTGLGILNGMEVLNARLGQNNAIRLAIRVGIHTGLVVVGEMGGGGHQEQLALSSTPNVASRLQGLAEPNAVLISETTHRLVEGYFTSEALSLARQLSHPFSLAAALNYVGMIHNLRRECRAAREHTEAAIALSSEQGFPQWLALGAAHRGWALAQEGQVEEGITQMRQFQSAWRAMGAEFGQQWVLAMLAEAHSKRGHAAEGLQALAEARALPERTGERGALLGGRAISA